MLGGQTAILPVRLIYQDAWKGSTSTVVSRLKLPKDAPWNFISNHPRVPAFIITFNSVRLLHCDRNLRGRSDSGRN